MNKAQAIMRMMALGLVTLALFAVSSSTSARAVEGISFSRDGSSWSSQLADPLFHESLRWVPGDIRTERFWVRNDSPLSARMDVDLIATSVDALIDTGDLLIEVRIGGDEWHPTSVDDTHRLASLSTAAGEAHSVDVRVTFLAEANNQSQTLPLALELRVTLTEDDSNAGTPSDSSGVGSGGAAGTEFNPVTILGDTGVPVGIAVILGGALLSAAGAWLVARRRRSREEGAG